MLSNDSFNFPLRLIKYIVIVLLLFNIRVVIGVELEVISNKKMYIKKKKKRIQ